VAELRAFTMSDPERWNAFVEGARYAAFPQLWEWGELREPFGWRPVRLAVGERPDEPIAGAQVLLRAIPGIGWKLGYAPRGPIGAVDDPAVLDALIVALRTLGRRERIATMKLDPAAGASDPLGTALLAEPWRAADKVQPPSSRILDLARTEEELRADLKKKHRQYVNKAERGGVTVEWLAPDAPAADVERGLADFMRIYVATAERGGFVARAPGYYERVWRLFAPGGRARLAFATLDGDRVAALFHFVTGERVAEAYGGMTERGAESRANYLLKWEAIRAFRAEGRASYDLWGIATGGIAQFKEGFGGEVQRYVGARDLPLRAPVDALLRVALPVYGMAQRLRLRLGGRRLVASDD
jgi:peptidoglycan pentaglycine glycine transferase (the first glycine)